MARTFGKVYPDVRHGKTVGWMIVCHVEGTRYRIRSVQVQGMAGWVPLTEDLAHHVLESIRAEIRGGTPELAAIAPYLRSHAPQRTFGAAWDRFVEAKIRQGRTEGRQVSRERLGELQGHRRRGHLAPLLDLPIERIDYGVLEDWRDGLFRRGLSSGSVHHLVADVGTCLRWLARRREIGRAPDLPTVRIARGQPRIPDPETQERLFRAIPWRLRGIFLARGMHGLRPSEARRARVSDWSRTLEPVTLADGSQVPVHTLGVRGKGGRDRRIPVPEGSELARWVAENVPEKAFGAEPLFANPEADPDGDGSWSASATRRVWRAACRVVFPEWDGSGESPYPENQSLRHAYATHLVNRGVALSSVGTALGHVDPRTTARYAQLGVGAHAAVLRPVGETPSNCPNPNEGPSK